jgi:type II secretory pathway pseudopilin PulG
MTENDTKNFDTNEVKPAQSGGYLLIVGTLLMVIIVLLAILWTQERAKRRAAEQAASHWQQQYQNLQQSMMLQMLGGGNLRPMEMTPELEAKIAAANRRASDPNFSLETQPHTQPSEP